MHRSVGGEPDGEPDGLRYQPFDGRPFRQRIGVRPLDLATWIEPDHHFASELAEKQRLLTDRHEDVFAALPYAIDASAEVRTMIEAHMRTYFPELVVEVPCGLHPLDAAGRQVQEDLCLMVPHDGELRLAAASLCFPGRWRLADKIGLPMLAIHQPVARYAQDIGAPTDDLLKRLSVERPVWRLNWSVVDDGALFQPGGHGRVDAPVVQPEDLFVRVERQTLRRLPATGAILFTIRTYLRLLPQAVVHAADRQRLADALAAMPDDVRAYKSLTTVADRAMSWLRDPQH